MERFLTRLAEVTEDKDVTNNINIKMIKMRFGMKKVIFLLGTAILCGSLAAAECRWLDKEKVTYYYFVQKNKVLELENTNSFLFLKS